MQKLVNKLYSYNRNNLQKNVIFWLLTWEGKRHRKTIIGVDVHQGKIDWWISFYLNT